MSPAEITARTAADIQPPLYYHLLHYWIILFGDGERALRGLSVLFGVLTIPLLYAVAWQLFHNRLAGLLASLLAAVAPLHIWYSQETRMYSLLTFLCLLSSYLLLLVIPLLLQEGKRWTVVALWAAYTIINTAALYTHYFAFFILAFQALYLLLVWGGKGLRPAQLIIGGMVSGMITLLAFLPWLPHVVARYAADVSYWPGQLKILEVLLDVAISFAGGESVLEPIGVALATGYGLMLILCLLALLVHGLRGMPYPPQNSPYPLAFLLLYLVLPPALMLALSYDSPKFNARYAMISHPAFLLILSGGLAVLWQPGTSGLSNSGRRALAAAALLFSLGASTYANVNAYSDPAFARADFRSVTRYLRKHVAADETIILSSGHMYPVFDYYAPDLERHLLPDSPTLDTTRTLDYSIAADLAEWLKGRGGVWVVLWQDNVVDPAGYLTTILGDVGEEQPVDRAFAKIGLRHYRLPANAAFSEQPAIAHPADLNFGGRLRLLGYTQTGARQITMFWEALQSLEEDYRVSLTLRDTMGQSWGQWDGRPTDYYYPTDRWPVGSILFGRYDLTPMPGAPPADYGLEVGVYTEDDPIGLDVLDPMGAPQGKRAMLGAVRLAVPAVGIDEVEIPHTGRIDLGGNLVLQGWDLDPVEAQPGDALLLTLIWSVESDPEGDYQVRLLVTDATGQQFDGGAFPPTNIWHRTSTWLAGQAWRGQVTFRLPIQTRPGEARLLLQRVDENGTVLAPPVELTSLQVLSTDRIFARPVPQAPCQVSFDSRIALIGADVAPDPVPPGDVLHMTLYWQALTEMDVPYTVFVHLLGPDGHVVSGQDGEPAGGTRPTTGWAPGEFIIDSHDVLIPAEVTPGPYLIEVGLYDAGVPGMPRLPTRGEEGQPGPDYVIFGPVQVR